MGAAAAPAAISAGGAIVGGAMQGKGSRTQTVGGPNLAQGLYPIARSAVNAGTQAGNAIDLSGWTPDAGYLANQQAWRYLNNLNPYLAAQTANAGQLGVQQGIANGFLPANLNRIEGALTPVLNRQFEQGAGQLREQAALTG